VLIKLLTSTTSSKHSKVPPTGLSLLKSFEVNHNDRWCFEELKPLGGLNMLLALVAVPHVVLVKNFWPLELIKAVGNRNFRGLLLTLVSLFVDSLSLFHS
jgi:hypothetical protein